MQDAQFYHAVFQREIERLNPAQQEAVVHIDGPVLVLAGPGTGKTHVLAARIGQILQQTDTQANNILCLTFTEAGVYAMRERLLQWIGPESHRVHIYTFHSFCNTVIQDNLEYFGRSDLEPLTDLERVEIIRQLLDDLVNTHPLRRRSSDPYFYESHLHDLFQRMKAENWSTAWVNTQIDHYLADLPNRKEFIYQTNSQKFRKGDPKQAKIDDVNERMERLRAAVDLFPTYATALQKAHRYDYEDMILWVLRAFAENETLLRTYQEQYLYVLVDEYQDTNGAQNAVLQQLISYWENPNIFIVGDDDQSIFEFQGARLKNLTDFYEQYRSGLKLVVLTDNYRSSQTILDASGALINNNEKRIVRSFTSLEVSKELSAQHPAFAKNSIHPKLFIYPNRAQEIADLVSQIDAMQKQGFPLQEVAVIYAKHKQANHLITLLEKKGIPYNTRRRVNILHLPMIVNLRQLLEYFQLEFSQPFSGEHLLFRILHFDFIGAHPADLATLSVYLDEHPGYWRHTIADPALLEKLPLRNPGAIHQFAVFFDQLLADLVNLPLIAWLERLINRSGLLRFAIQHADKIWWMQVLTTFFDFVRAETDRNPRINLRRLLDILRRMDDNRLAIELNKNIAAADGVNLVTAHSAKGLEFQRVFLFDCVQEQWEPQRRGNAFRFSLPDTLTFSGEEDALEARRRLFYVAMTRAKELLYLSYSVQDTDESPLTRAIFIEELSSAAHLKTEEKTVAPAVVLEAAWLQMVETERPRAPEQDRAEVDKLLEGFTLNISALNRFLRCPLSFYYEYILRAPVLQSEAASYGIAAHFALQRLFDRMMGSPDKVFPPEEEFIGFFVHAMEKERNHFSPREWERKLDWGRQHLAAYYRQHQPHWYKKVRVEFNVRNVSVAGVPISGVIDKVELHEGLQTIVLDYKTGRHDPGRLRRPTEGIPHGGSYWRQLVFYKLLYEAFEGSSRQVGTGVISYLDPDSKGYFPQHRLDITSEDVSVVTNLIGEVYTRIQRHEFYEGCGRNDCPWCNFVRNNTLVNSFSDPELEALDD